MLGSKLASGEKHAQALAVLRAAELQTGVKNLAENRTFAAPTPQVDEAATPEIHLNSSGFPVAPALAPLVPGGELAPGIVVVITGSSALLLGMLAASSRAGRWCAFVGCPEISALAAAQMGVDLERVAFIKNPEVESNNVISTLVNAMTVVVGPEVRLVDSDRRRLAARVRESGQLLISTQPWAGAQLEYSVTGRSFGGLKHGLGDVQGYRLEVLRSGRAQAAAPKTFLVNFHSFPLVAQT
jgi:hypothetical protein